MARNGSEPRTPTQMPILELMHKRVGTLGNIDKGISYVDLAKTAAQMWAGVNAFRRYNALANLTSLNTAGDFRGMVLSARWRSVFNVTSNVGKYTENLGVLAGLVAGIAEAAPQIEQTLQSRDAGTIKGAKLASMAGTIAERTLLGIIPAGTHLIYRSLEGWCMLIGLAGGNASDAANTGIRVLQNADALVTTTFNAVTDTQNQANAILHPVATARDAWSAIQVTISPR